MKCNWMRWLWGIIPLLILGWLAVEAEHTRIERDLSDRSQAELQKAGLAWASSAFQGRDSTLSGKASDIADPDKATGVLAKVWGVRIVDNKSEMIEQVDNYNWTASRKANRVRLTGYVPNAMAKQTIMGMARASFPGFEIQDRMRLARGVPSVDTWLGGVSYALKLLTYIERGDVRLDGLTLTATGEAEDVNGYRALRSVSVPKGIKLGSASFTAPPVKPHVFTARFDGKALAFKGHVPSDTEVAFVVAAARETLRENAISDDAEPGSGAAPGWKEAAAIAVRTLVKLENGSAEIKDEVITLAGLARDEDSAETARKSLKSLPGGFKLIDQLYVKPKPVEPAQAPQPAPTIALPAIPPPPPAFDLQPRQVEPQTKAPATPAATPGPPAPSSPQTETRAPAATPPPAAPAPAAPKMAEPASPLVAPPAKKAEPAPPAAPAAPKTAAPAAPIAPQVPASPAQIQAAKTCEDNLTKLAADGTILFRYASADVSQASFDTLEKLAAAAKGCPGMIIEIGGFASAEGEINANQRLSEARAQSVLTFLVKTGVDAQQLEAKGYGIAKPVAPNTSAENMAKNRRIEFSVRPKLETR